MSDLHVVPLLFSNHDNCGLIFEFIWKSILLIILYYFAYYFYNLILFYLFEGLC